jgi:hypothetical protein
VRIRVRGRVRGRVITLAALNNHADVVDMLLLHDIDVYAETEVIN